MLDVDGVEHEKVVIRIRTRSRFSVERTTGRVAEKQPGVSHRDVRVQGSKMLCCANVSEGLLRHDAQSVPDRRRNAVSRDLDLDVLDVRHSIHDGLFRKASGRAPREDLKTQTNASSVNSCEEPSFGIVHFEVQRGGVQPCRLQFWVFVDVDMEQFG
ncbi:hypothetical protein BJ508DRAFT_302623 [Ascobolus immersus RN42]|uniref:Uncharacterized protein n=1 Tax=Ascobolus immersus RN42 TaxID=1160509 RepID=A0A3N4II30_ASCIM|nr:hypothetical protein BJ508DRAFT_302623 [Ascobolus immersus RN42]